MHFHLPKPLHGWREFAGEVGIIVLGVLIALGAEQAIEGVHERYIAEQSRRDVREEVGTDMGFYRGRLQESSCIASRLAELSQIVKRGTIPKNTLLWIGQPGGIPIFAERWHAVTSSARSAMFPPDEQFRLDAIYGIFADMDQVQRNEQEAWTSLDVMEQLDGPIDNATRFALLRAVEQARQADAVIRLAGYYALFHAGKLGISSNPETSPRPGDVHSICLPLSTSPQQAERLLQPLRVPH